MNQARKTQPDNVTTSASAGILLTKGGLLVLLAVMVLAAWNRQVVIVILLGLALSAAGLSSLWSRLSLSGVSCQRLLSENRAFPGETIELKLKLSNRKLIPLPWIEVDSEIPLQLLADPASLPAGETPGTRLLSHITSLLWYTSVSWRQKLDCPRRGYYKLGPVTVTSGDIFGWYPRSITWKRTDEIIVYPKIFPSRISPSPRSTRWARQWRSGASLKTPPAPSACAITPPRTACVISTGRRARDIRIYRSKSSSRRPPSKWRSFWQ